MTLDRTVDAILAELKRIGLGEREMPAALAVYEDGADAVLARLQALPAGAEMRDVFPDMPAHWIPDRAETWTHPYSPLGPDDYQELPASPAIDVVWGTPSDTDRLEGLLAAVREAGWRVHAAWSQKTRHPDFPVLSMIVLERGTTIRRAGELMDWVRRQPGVVTAGITRLGDEEYFRDEPPSA